MTKIPLDQIRHWLFDEALPYWAQHGRDHAHGGPVEELSLTGSSSDPGFKRVRVFCRQVYVFSHAYLLGWGEGLEHAHAMYDAMVQFAWQGKEKGWAKTLTSNNVILDPTTDLYDNAFALYAMGWYYRVNPKPAVLNFMLETAAVIDENMRHPKGGFWHQLPAIGPRIQNPHMHLLEACLACFEATKEPIFKRLGREVVGLFQTKFYNSDQHTLGEYFTDELDLDAGEKGLIVEPGHQFEWAWILASARNHFHLDVDRDIRDLIAFGEKFGVDHATGATYNAIRADGSGLDLGSRTWPNTERLKAAVASFEVLGLDTRPILCATLKLLFDRYLNVTPAGGWIDAFDTSGTPIAKAMPTSTFYHLFLAFAEVLRVGDRLNALD